MFKWSNPHNVNFKEPYLYFIRVNTGTNVYRYIGKATNKSRLNEYRHNVEKILSGKARRPIIKKDGGLQSNGNLRYRYVHLVLSVAEMEGWLIEHYPIENVNKADLSSREQELIKEFGCNMNNQGTWEIKEFSKLSANLIDLESV